MDIHLTPWPSPEPPTEPALRDILQAQGLRPYSWSNAPYDVYAAHSHTYDKVIYAVSGSITFGLPEHDRKLTLNPGDRLDLPAGTTHDAVVGSAGVICLEAHIDRLPNS